MKNDSLTENVSPNFPSQVVSQVNQKNKIKFPTPGLRWNRKCGSSVWENPQKKKFTAGKVHQINPKIVLMFLFRNISRSSDFVVNKTREMMEADLCLSSCYSTLLCFPLLWIKSELWDAFGWCYGTEWLSCASATVSRFMIRTNLDVIFLD